MVTLSVEDIPMRTQLFVAAAVVVTAGCASAPQDPTPTSPTDSRDRAGLLVMAHGGSDEWNETVAEVVAPVREEVPVAVAFGMADPATMADGLDSLRLMGVTHVAVIRMFISGQSFLPQTRYLLGLSDERPEFFVHAEGESVPPPGMISRGLVVATHEAGLMDSDEATLILSERARASSNRPEQTSVLLLAHGMGDEKRNEEVKIAMGRVSAAIAHAGFGSVFAATLREDWPEKRKVVERQVREFVGTEAEAGRQVIVVPMRLSGFGPYAEVLDGLEYSSTEGLLPHPAVTEWIRNTGRRVMCDSGWTSHTASCATSSLVER